MIVSGVLLSATSVAVLGRCLQRGGHNRLADDVGLALDADWHELVLAPTEESQILSVLDDCPAELEPLRLVLQAPRAARLTSARFAASGCSTSSSSGKSASRSEDG